ncbi:hypothetical protein C8Q75DRAFT_193015 [Abortiporus biennis]|nr:hypothetical protein C8Q75DRAFT_193015 [Abortiporus biennis]
MTPFTITPSFIAMVTCTFMLSPPWSFRFNVIILFISHCMSSSSNLIVSTISWVRTFFNFNLPFCALSFFIQLCLHPNFIAYLFLRLSILYPFLSNSLHIPISFFHLFFIFCLPFLLLSPSNHCFTSPCDSYTHTPTHTPITPLTSSIAACIYILHFSSRFSYDCRERTSNIHSHSSSCMPLCSPPSFYIHPLFSSCCLFVVIFCSLSYVTLTYLGFGNIRLGCRCSWVCLGCSNSYSSSRTSLCLGVSFGFLSYSLPGLEWLIYSNKKCSCWYLVSRFGMYFFPPRDLRGLSSVAVGFEFESRGLL